MQDGYQFSDSFAGSQSLRSASRQINKYIYRFDRVLWCQMKFTDILVTSEGVDCVRVMPKYTEMQFALP